MRDLQSDASSRRCASWGEASLRHDGMKVYQLPENKVPLSAAVANAKAMAMSDDRAAVRDCQSDLQIARAKHK